MCVHIYVVNTCALMSKLSLAGNVISIKELIYL